MKAPTSIVYVICAAGLGTRTREISADIPKPLLILENKLLLEHAIGSFSIRPEDRVIIIGLERHQLERAQPQLLNRWPAMNLSWVNLENVTRGQLETAILGIQKLGLSPDSTSGLVIFNADSAFSPIDLAVDEKFHEWEGLIPVSKEPGDAWSFAAVSKEDESPMPVTRVTEKQRISPWCSTGFYYFRTWSLFRSFASLEIESMKGSDQEIYVAPIYNRYLAAGKKVGALAIMDFKAMGSLEQINTYWSLGLADLVRENEKSIYG